MLLLKLLLLPPPLIIYEKITVYCSFVNSFQKYIPNPCYVQTSIKSSVNYSMVFLFQC